MKELKNYIQEQLHYAKLYKGKKQFVLSFEERAFGASRMYDRLTNGQKGMQEFEKQLEKFQKLY